MQFLIDNAAAALVAGTLFLMLVVVNHRSQQAQAQATGYYALRQQQVSFVRVLRRDMAGIVALQDVQEDAARNFTFETRLADDDDVTVVTYHREQVGTRDGTPLYQIQRFEDSSSPTPGGDYDGGSMRTITEWEMTALNENGSTPSDPANATQVRVRFAFVLPFEGTGDGTMPLRRWQATFQPRLLNQDLIL